jgi:hypothetical protein
LTLCVDATRDIEFLTEICNGTLGDKFDNRGNAKLMWVKKDDGIPNDWRDCIRYGLALGQLIVESGDIPLESTPSKAVQEEKENSAFVRTPDAEGRSGGWIRRRSN